MCLSVYQFGNFLMHASIHIERHSYHYRLEFIPFYLLLHFITFLFTACLILYLLKLLLFWSGSGHPLVGGLLHILARWRVQRDTGERNRDPALRGCKDGWTAVLEHCTSVLHPPTPQPPAQTWSVLSGMDADLRILIFDFCLVGNYLIKNTK